jgi:hypothetical protein
VLTGKIIRPRPSWPSVFATDASWLDSVLDRGTYGEEVRPGEALDGETDEEPLDEELLDEELLDEELLDEEVLEEPEPASYRDVWGKLAHWPRLVRPWVTLLAAWIADSFRKHPIESLAAVLLGIGGAAFPPVWLLGAAMALVSHLWDGRDKWIGLALPVIGTLLGTVAGVCLTASGSLGHDVHNGWVFADVLSRIAAVIGATYLGWRGVRGRRPPAVPPWARAHRVG